MHELDIEIIKPNFSAILGGDSCTQMGLVQIIYKVDKNMEADILQEYKYVFTGLGCIPGQHHI